MKYCNLLLGCSEKELLQLGGNIYETRDLTFSDMVLHYFTWKNNLFERKQSKMVIWKFFEIENTSLTFQYFAFRGNSNIHNRATISKEVFSKNSKHLKCRFAHFLTQSSLAYRYIHYTSSFRLKKNKFV